MFESVGSGGGTSAATKDRILQAAEKLFSDEGLAKTSLRAITAEAGVNVAAIHYHFGSKQGLLLELLARRVEPVNRERIRLLDEIERHAGAEAPGLEAVLEAFVAPILRIVDEGDAERRKLLALIGRFYAEPDELLEPVIREQFGEVGERFTRALRRALPELSAKDVAWRLHCTIGVLTHVLTARHDFGVLPGFEAGVTQSGRALVDRLVGFLAAGFRAPAGRRA
jgi:AcrR family transcriptional regulator